MFDINKIKEQVSSSKDKQEIIKLMKKYKINYKELKNMINNLTIYCDYDEVLADLVTPWLKYLNDLNGTNWKSKDVDSFYWFNEQANGIEFLNNRNLYDNIPIKKGSIEFFETLKKNNMLENLTIVTATVTPTIESKEKHMKKYFKDYINLKKVVTTGSKWQMDYTNAVLIDDGAHNVEDTVIKNPYAHAFILNYSHNKDLYDGKRITRINSLNEFFNHLPLLVLKKYDRFFDPEQKHLREENFSILKDKRKSTKLKEKINFKNNNEMSI